MPEDDFNPLIQPAIILELTDDSDASKLLGRKMSLDYDS
jgi:hypothetical protein